ncbi:gp53-like domain-containing protein, partial [Yersinia mollaretii]|uniref:gp53-like domain-containing protein n=1 Tax=Yersinia mollaretii TaxID=33060 RepID=UPI00066FCBB9
AATKNVGTTPGTVAAGDDPRLNNGWTYGGTLERGWRKDPHGNIEQWGNDAVASGTSVAITLPIAFPTSFVGVVLQPVSSVGVGTGEANTRINKTSLNTFAVYSGSGGSFVHMWRAWGY